MDTHLHHEEHMKSSETLQDIVIGMSDGLTVPFALAAGLSGAVSSNDVIVIAGIAEIAAGSIAMGLGGYLAGKTEQDHYKSEEKREYYEVDNLRDKEIEETREIFAEIGLSSELQEKATEEISRDKKRWVNFMMNFELGLEEPDPRRAARSALTIALSYIVGGLIPLSPYMLVAQLATALYISVAVTLAALFAFGYIKGHFTGAGPLRSGLQTLLVGGLAAAAAFTLARLFG